VIGGDLNLDSIKYNSSNAITDYFNCLLSCGCVSLINKPTRFLTNCVPSLLDHIYTNIVDEQKINDVGIDLFDISNHLPVFINFFTFTACKNNRPKIRCPKKFHPEQFLLDLEENITKLPADNEDKISNTALDHHAPYRFASRKEQHTFQKPWLTKGILKSVGTKNKMFKKQIKSSNPHLIEQFKIYRNKLTHLKELSKQDYFRSVFKKYNNNAKKTWQLFNNLITLKNNWKHNTPQNNRPNAKFKC